VKEEKRENQRELTADEELRGKRTEQFTGGNSFDSSSIKLLTEQPQPFLKDEVPLLGCYPPSPQRGIANRSKQHPGADKKNGGPLRSTGARGRDEGKRIVYRGREG